MPSEPRTGHQLYHGDALAPVAATAVVATAILTIYVVQIGLYSAGLVALGAAVVADVVVLVGLVAYARRRQLRAWHFGLRRPAGKYLVAAGLVGVSAWYLNLQLVLLIDPPGDTTNLQQVVEHTGLASTVLAIALVPAITEELVFRGVFLRAIATRFRPGPAIVLAAVVFALYHLLPAQIVSTFGLGLALGYLTWRAGSAVPAMVAHLLNNTIAIVISRDELPALGSWMGEHSVVMLASTTVLLAGGLWIAARGPR